MAVLSYSRMVIFWLFVSSLVDGQEESGNTTFPQSPPLTSQQVVRLGSASCDIPEARTVIDNAIHDFFQDKIEYILPCTPEMIGTLPSKQLQ